MADESAVTTYGVANTAAPAELGTFAFFVGKWEGAGRTQLPDGGEAEFPVTWIGRYVLDGMAIADELHSVAPDGSPYLGISLRHFDPQERTWIVEYLNVSNSFVRRQVNGRSGSVEVKGDTIFVIAKDGEMTLRECYRIENERRFVYSIDISKDGGQSWDAGSIEMTMTKVE